MGYPLDVCTLNDNGTIVFSVSSQPNAREAVPTPTLPLSSNLFVSCISFTRSYDYRLTVRVRNEEYRYAR